MSIKRRNMSKFVINKGMSNEFIITIKQNGTTLPMSIEQTDTFVAKLIKMSDSTVAGTLDVQVEDAVNGKIKVTVSSEIASGLEVAKGDKADLYYSKPRYKLAIDCDTANNGKFVAKVEKVYVE